jgi:Collagen triple helix repeat (20 copies)
MKSRSEVSTAGGEQKMEGVNMPASFKSAWRWLVAGTAAAVLCVVALPGVGRAENIEICIKNNNGKIKGINLGVGGCTGNTTELDWVTTGPAGYTGLEGVVGNPGPAGTQGYPGSVGAAGPTGPEGAAGPQGPEGEIGPTGPTGPGGVMGENGVRGATGVGGATGPTGASGTPGVQEPEISVFTGGSMGTFGVVNNVALTGNNSVGTPGTILILGPGNGSDTSETTEVPMSEAGTAERLFVAVDNDPGTQMNNGIPTTFFFFLCENNSFPLDCNVACFMSGPDTTCNDLEDTQSFAVGDFMSLWAFASYPGADLTTPASVKWSVTYDHGAFITPPPPPI